MFPGVPKMRDLEPTFSQIGDWIRYSQTGWLVWTSISTIDLMQTVRAAIDRQDSVLISAIELEDLAGQLPNWVWDWIKSKGAGGVLTETDDPNLFKQALLPRT